jgi:hypothetical protein
LQVAVVVVGMWVEAEALVVSYTTVATQLVLDLHIL